jgi:hypothetical protein
MEMLLASSGEGHLPSMCEALGSVSSTTKNKNEKPVEVFVLWSTHWGLCKMYTSFLLLVLGNEFREPHPQ